MPDEEMDLVEVFRKALMRGHHQDWSMDTVSEAAHICAQAMGLEYQRMQQEVVELRERLNVAQKEMEWLRTCLDERLRAAPRLPASMTPAKLRLLADWFDTYDRMAEGVIEASRGVVGDAEATAAMRVARGKEVQNDLRAWADEIEGKGG